MNQTTIAALETVLPKLSTSDQSFAHSLLSSWKRNGTLSAKQEPWVAKLISRAATPRADVKVGTMTGVIALFDRARKHLKRPAIVLGVPALGAETAIRLNVAGERAKVPGSLTVLDANKSEEGDRAWLGRILLDGTYQPSGHAVDALAVPAIVARLEAFAANPAAVASEHGKLTGRCCFCNLPLTDDRSTAVGYGKTCASHYGLAWGAARATFSCDAS